MKKGAARRRPSRRVTGPRGWQVTEAEAVWRRVQKTEGRAGWKAQWRRSRKVSLGAADRGPRRCRAAPFRGAGGLVSRHTGAGTLKALPKL